MKALCIKQPWAWLIVNGYKDIENRSWKPPKNFALPQRIYVYSSKRAEKGIKVMSLVEQTVPDKFGIYKQKHYVHFEPLGCIVGEVDIIDCRCDYQPKSPWAEPNMWQWHLANPIAYEDPIPYKGKLGFFDVKLLSMSPK